jgi:hypothetical protein
MIASTKERWPHNWEIWFLSFILSICFMTVDFSDLWTCFIWIYDYIFEIVLSFMS